MALERLIFELQPRKLRKNLKRFWEIYVIPPKERSIFIPPEKLPQISRKINQIPTRKQPKQVIFDSEANLAYVSCMEGKTLQVFRIKENDIILQKNIEFEDQCVEVLAGRRRIFVTTTNFERLPSRWRNKLWILDTHSLETISSVNTGGNWSKLIAIRPQEDELLISNWHSHDISVIDIKNPSSPKLRQVLKWGEAPRGIGFLPTGNEAIVTGFYSGNLGVLERNQTGKWEVTFTSQPFDFPNYPGNMRHVLISQDGKQAMISNLGRNLVHVWDIKERRFLNSFSVGKSPNSMSFIKKDVLAVSCRNSSSVYLLDLSSQQILGRSELTGKEPTGLCSLKSGFLVTCFGDNTLEWHDVSLNHG